MRVSSVWREKLYSDVLLKAPHACNFFCELLIFHRDFRKNMYFTRFSMHFSNVHFSWKNHHFLFVTPSHLFGFSSNFYRRSKIQLPYGICTLKRQITPFPRGFFFENMKFQLYPDVKKLENPWFFWVFSFVLILFSKSKIVRWTRFCGLRAIRCRKRTCFLWFRI